MEQPIPDRNRRYTVEEYFRICETSDIKYEYWEGQLVPLGGWQRDWAGNVLGMAGTTRRHGLIACNFIGELRGRLKGEPCEVYNSDVRVCVSRSGRYVLPDASVTCGEPAFDPPEDELTLVNPQVVIEVLSPSTASDDRGDKFRDYIAIESLQQYVLADG